MVPFVSDHDNPTPETAAPWVELDQRFAIIPEELLYDAAIPADAVRLYGALARHGTDPANCYPSHRRLATLLGKSPRSIPAWIRALEAAGWIERIPRWRRGALIVTERPERLGDGWEVTSNAYRVHTLRVDQREVRAHERGALHGGERAASAPERAPNESQVNESQPERELTLVGAPLSADALLAAGFDRFWEAYPRATAKGQARTAWGAAVKSAGSIETVIEGAERYRDDPNREDRYTKHPATWLRGECWADPPLPARKGAPAPRIIEDRTGTTGRIEL